MWLRDPSVETSTAQLVYDVDQELAHASVPYFPVRYGWFVGLEILVPTQYVEIVDEMLRRNGQELPRPVPPTRAGFTRSVEPQRLSKAYADHPWSFRSYWETLPDGQRYETLLFRDRDHRRYGIREWVLAETESPPQLSVFRKLARRIVTDEEFGKGLLSDDPALEDYWR